MGGGPGDLRLILVPRVIQLLFLGALLGGPAANGFLDLGTDRPEWEITMFDAMRCALPCMAFGFDRYLPGLRYFSRMQST